ncbi:Tumor protein p63-regulated protein 1-like protein, partial [Goodea atripinnis]
VDHWNNEKERLVVITDNTLMIFKYDFVMLCCEQIQKVQLNYIDRISHGSFSFPKRSVLKEHTGATGNGNTLGRGMKRKSFPFFMGKDCIAVT